MQILLEKVAYLKGLAEGLNISRDTKEGTMLLAIVDTLECFAAKLSSETEDEAAPELTNAQEFGYICPNCSESIYVEESVIVKADPIICTKCNEPIIIVTHEI